MKNAPQKDRTVSFDVTDDEQRLILQITKRAAKEGVLEWLGGTLMDLDMDLCATHANGCPLDFATLLTFDRFSFTHDLAGIRRHIDRETGELGDCFLPRCARPASSPDGVDN